MGSGRERGAAVPCRASLLWHPDGRPREGGSSGLLRPRRSGSSSAMSGTGAAAAVVVVVVVAGNEWESRALVRALCRSGLLTCARFHLRKHGNALVAGMWVGLCCPIPLRSG